LPPYNLFGPYIFIKRMGPCLRPYISFYEEEGPCPFGVRGIYKKNVTLHGEQVPQSLPTYLFMKKRGQRGIE
jgi:hypothetical protein